MKVDIRLNNFGGGGRAQIEIDVPDGFRLADMVTTPLIQVGLIGTTGSDGSFVTVLRFERVKP